MNHDAIHTISVGADTVLEIIQEADKLPKGHPTKAFRPAGFKEPVDLRGLYDFMTYDRIFKRLRQYMELKRGL